MTRLIVTRHGNTFEAHEEPRRVGLRTDLPLTQSGIKQAEELSVHLKKSKMVPDEIYSSNLNRAYKTAQIIAEGIGHAKPIHILDMFNEIDYGPDENKPEYEVVARIGQQAIEDWNDKGVVPEGWHVNIDEITTNWQTFSERIRAFDDNQTILVVTSNGIARFAPAIADYSGSFNPQNAFRLRTGAFGLLEHVNDQWGVREWNTRPTDKSTLF